jgi:hypothetical protein
MTGAQSALWQRWSPAQRRLSVLCAHAAGDRTTAPLDDDRLQYVLLKDQPRLVEFGLRPPAGAEPLAAQLEREGYVVLQDMLGRPQLHALRGRFEELCREEGRVNYLLLPCPVPRHVEALHNSWLPL